MFRFKLEALLNHRRHQEEVLQKELAKVIKKQVYEQKELRKKNDEKRRYIREIQGRQQKSAIVGDLILYVNYLAKLSIQIEKQQHRVYAAARTVDQTRAKLLVIVKKRKILERLKEKDLLVYQQKMMHDERKLMDEIASTRHIRRG